MKLPRDLTGAEMVRLLRRQGYEFARQTGSHVRLESTAKGRRHRVTVPLHNPLRVGTLAAIVRDVAAYLDVDADSFSEELFG